VLHNDFTRWLGRDSVGAGAGKREGVGEGGESKKGLLYRTLASQRKETEDSLLDP